MAYYEENEHGSRIDKMQKILGTFDLDFAIVYYDEFNLANE